MYEADYVRDSLADLVERASRRTGSTPGLPLAA
jgi:hypothetical protein